MSSRNPFQRRNHRNIILDILGCLKRFPETRYAIGVNVNLKYRDLNRYLGQLVNTGLIDAKTEGGRVFYRLTAKGSDFLGSHRPKSHSFAKSDIYDSGSTKERKECLKTELFLFGKKIYERRRIESISPVPNEIDEESLISIKGKVETLPSSSVNASIDRKKKRHERYAVA
jgi:predicted transcriptional regulator